MQLQYIQLIADKTNADDLSRTVFAILITVTMAIYKTHCHSTNFVKNWQTAM